MGSVEVTTYLGIDGGGTKTDFLLIDESGQVRAAHRGGPAYYPETGLPALQAMLAEGIRETLRQGQVQSAALGFAFIGLPAYGEDTTLLPRLQSLVADVLPHQRYGCGNDMVCGWAGALAGADGINIVAGTGSIAYGEFGGRSARAGGWGELFSDEGSAYWIAREGLTVFSRMSDGRVPQGPLYHLLREHFRLTADLDLCAAIYGPPALTRSELASLAPLVSAAAVQADAHALQIFEKAAIELAAMVHAVRRQLDVPAAESLAVSYSGGLFRTPGLLTWFESALVAGRQGHFKMVAPQLNPAAGAALYAAKLSGAPLSATSVSALASAMSQGEA